jgi:hypothetical protein
LTDKYTVDPVLLRPEVVPGAQLKNGGWHGGRRRLGLEEAGLVDDMGRSGELQEQQQNRRARPSYSPETNPHCCQTTWAQGAVGRWMCRSRGARGPIYTAKP